MNIGLGNMNKRIKHATTAAWMSAILPAMWIKRSVKL